jgi:spermidine synthase
LLPTILMGGTLPLLARALVHGGDDAERKLSLLYGVNTLGAAFGTLLGNYALVRFLGIYGALVFGAIVNVWIFRRARRLARASGPPAPPSPPLAAATPAEQRAPVPAAVAGAGLAGVHIPWRLAAFTAFVTGFFSFLYEIVWTHLLATVVGTSVYAFGLMLFTFLLGMAGGSLAVSRGLLHGRLARPRLVGLLQISLGAVVVVTLPLWDKLPYVFLAATLLYPGFYLMETIRALVCMAILLAPSFAIGATFPLLLETSATDPRRLGRRIGALYALNTAGCIAGAVVTGFWLLERLGSQRALALGGVASALLGLAYVRLGSRAADRSFRRAGVAVLAVIAAAALVPRWNLEPLARGMNVYFDGGAEPGQVVFLHEDAQGGFTTISRNERGLTLRTNGKFQGNDGDEVEAQYGFALVPVLFTRHFDSALVIGYGTGTTAGVLSRFPFQHIEIAELARGIIAAERYFHAINFDVLADPRVKLVLNDGRNHLLLARHRYDLITVELTSVWFAGAANLYNREFYELARDRLAPGGVLQQWVQLHHIDRLDLLVLWNTMRRVFPHVSLWVRGGQGLLIASSEPQILDYAHVAEMNAAPAAAPLKARLAVPDFFSLLGGLALDDEAMDGALEALRRWIGPDLSRLLISSDYFPYLEYATPAGNALRWARESNVKWIDTLDRRRLPQIRGVPDRATATRIQILAAHARGGCDRVLRLAASDGAPAGDELVAKLRRECEARTAATDY